MDEDALNGRRILIIEDEHIVAESLSRALRTWGAIVVGAIATVEQSLAFLDTDSRIDGALLDINLRGVSAYAVADALIARGVPLVFTTGYDTQTTSSLYPGVTILTK